MIRVIIADDHTLVRAGIRALLERTGDVKVIGEATDGSEAVALTEKLWPDVVILDIAMPRMNGIQAAERIRAVQRGTPILLLSMHHDEILLRQALQLGIEGFVLKDDLADHLLQAVRAVQQHDRYFSHALEQRITADLHHRPAVHPLEQLSPREREVLQLVAEGRTNAEIAHIMVISVKTVEKHRANLMLKLGVNDVAGLVRMAIRAGLIPLDG